MTGLCKNENKNELCTKISYWYTSLTDTLSTKLLLVAVLLLIFQAQHKVDHLKTKYHYLLECEPLCCLQMKCRICSNWMILHQDVCKSSCLQFQNRSEREGGLPLKNYGTFINCAEGGKEKVLIFSTPLIASLEFTKHSSFTLLFSTTPASSEKPTKEKLNFNG